MPNGGFLRCSDGAAYNRAMADENPPQQESLAEAIARAARVMAQVISEREDVRQALRGLMQALTSALGSGYGGQPAGVVEQEPEPVDEAAEQAAPAAEVTTERLRLQIGDAAVQVPVTDTPEALEGVRQRLEQTPAVSERRPAAARPTPRKPAPQIDLVLVAKRCQLKAEACRWVVQRRRRLAESAPFEQAIKPQDDQLNARARELPDCYVWMLDPHGPQVSDELLEMAGGLYETLASAIELVQEVRGSDDCDRRNDAYQLLAEAQSALRVLLEHKVGLSRKDTDQDQAFMWLRERTRVEEVYIRRHMRLDDPADPEGWFKLLERIEQVRGEFHGARQQQRLVKNELGRARYSAQKLLRDEEVDRAGRWQSLVSAIDRLVEAGRPPSDPELRDIVLPLLDELPTEVEEKAPEGFLLVLREIDRYLANKPAGGTAEDREVAQSPALAQARELLAGRVVLMIGGYRQREAEERLRRAMDLEELRWVPTMPNLPLYDIEPQIARPEVAVVVLMIRWTAHVYGNIREFCERHGKPLVRLPGGYGSNQVAHQIVQQVGQILGREAEASSTAG